MEGFILHHELFSVEWRMEGDEPSLGVRRLRRFIVRKAVVVGFTHVGRTLRPEQTV